MTILETLSKASKYPQTSTNMLMLLSTGTHLTKTIFTRLNKDFSQYPAIDKLNTISSQLFLFIDVDAMLSSAYGIVKNSYAYYQYGVVGKSNEDIRKAGDEFPKEANAHLWFAGRAIAAVAGIFSTGVLAYGILKGTKALSHGPTSAMQTAGAGAGLLHYALKLNEIARQKRENLNKDGSFQSAHRLSEDKKADPGDHTALCQTKWTYEQWSTGIVAAIKVVSLLSALHAYHDQLPVPFNKITKLVNGHSSDLYGTIFSVYTVVDIIHHMHVGAELTKLEKK